MNIIYTLNTCVQPYVGARACAHIKLFSNYKIDIQHYENYLSQLSFLQQIWCILLKYINKQTIGTDDIKRVKWKKSVNKMIFVGIKEHAFNISILQTDTRQTLFVQIWCAQRVSHQPQKKSDDSKTLSLFLCVYVWVFMYIHTWICICRYVCVCSCVYVCVCQVTLTSSGND